MSLNTVPTNYHEYEYSKFSVFKLKFMTTGRIHAERCCVDVWREAEGRESIGLDRAGDEGTCISSIGEGEAQQRLA